MNNSIFTTKLMKQQNPFKQLPILGKIFPERFSNIRYGCAHINGLNGKVVLEQIGRHYPECSYILFSHHSIEQN